MIFCYSTQSSCVFHSIRLFRKDCQHIDKTASKLTNVKSSMNSRKMLLNSLHLVIALLYLFGPLCQRFSDIQYVLLSAIRLYEP